MSHFPVKETVVLVGVKARLFTATVVAVVLATLVTPAVADEGPGSPPPPPLFATSLAVWEQSLQLRSAIDLAAREARAAPADLPAQTIHEVVDVWEGSLGSCCLFYDVSAVVSPGVVKVVFSGGDTRQPAWSAISLSSQLDAVSPVKAPPVVRRVLKTGQSLALAFDRAAQRRQVAPADLTAKQLSRVAANWSGSRRGVSVAFPVAGKAEMSLALKYGDKASAMVVLSAERGGKSAVVL